MHATGTLPKSNSRDYSAAAYIFLAARARAQSFPNAFPKIPRAISYAAPLQSPKGDSLPHSTLQTAHFPFAPAGQELTLT